MQSIFFSQTMAVALASLVKVESEQWYQGHILEVVCSDPAIRTDRSQSNLTKETKFEADFDSPPKRGGRKGGGRAGRRNIRVEKQTVD